MTSMQEAAEAARRRWHQDRALSDIGLTIDDQGSYVPFRARCAPGLGWPIAARREPAIDPGHVQVLLSGQARRKLREVRW